MLRALDHIIVGVNDLEQAERVFSQKLGLALSGGGIHPYGGTANRVVVIGDTYVELIAVRTPQEAQGSMLARLAKGDGYLNFVLASDDIEAEAAAMRGRGVKAIGPKAGQLRSADGRVRGWSRLDVEVAELTQHYPFVIQHDSVGEERRFRLAGWTVPPTHALGVAKVLSATIAVANLEEASQRFEHLYGLQASEPFTGEADGWEAMLVSFSLGESGQSFELAVPLLLSANAGVADNHLTEPGGLGRYLQVFGESLCRVSLAVENLTASRRYLDQHGVTYTYGDGIEHPVLWVHGHEACGATMVLHELIS